MIADERIDGFVNGFIDSWLNLRDLGGMPPPRETNRAYYAEDLPSSMKTEARLFFRDLLKNNGSVAQFIDCEHTFVDKKLAKLYDLPEKDKLRLADGFQKVSLKGNNHRGGLLGMAAVLTVSANGVETSPVTRGVWVTENILGIPPPPPPDVVPAIDPDVSGATTIRDRLAKHRADAACAECHRKIDPLGFSLEAFDPVGRWRKTYPKPKKRQRRPQDRHHRRIHLRRDLRRLRRLQKGHPRHPRRPLHPPPHPPAPHLHHRPHHGTQRRPPHRPAPRKVKKQGLGLNTLMVECLMSEVFRSR
jgi:hypothetical protein